MQKNPKVLVILGPTASGKTKLAVELARQLNGEIISADSRQVYKGMDIGTGKDLAEYGMVKYHLIDVIKPDKQFDLKKYQAMAYGAINDVLKRKKLPILVGGSGLYLQAVVDGYILANKTRTTEDTDLELKTLKEIQNLVAKQDKTFFNRLNNSEKNNKRRLIRYLEILQNSKQILKQPRVKTPPYEFMVIGLNISIDTLRKKIKKRLLDRLKNDVLIKEVKKLHKAGLSWQRLESFGLEYKFVSQYLQKKLSKQEMIEKLNIAIGQFAKRQMTWFRRWEKQGREIKWLKLSKNKPILANIDTFK